VTQGIETETPALLNPFPPAAVASFAARGWVSIPTAAADMARTNVVDYLAKAARARSSGRCVAIVGDFGTGKTHLALEMLQTMEDLTEGKSTRVYVDAPGEGFISLYRDRFLPQVDRTELRQRVLEYYADIVSEELADSEIATAMVTALRNGTISPETVVDRFALGPTRLLNRLAERLRKVTQQPQFATALTLFLRPEYEATVWQWLSTTAPDPVLAERGVTKTIDTDVDALEAIGVVALLYGHRGHRFALALDELEKILVPLAEAERGGDVILGLKRLMQIFTHTGALLILCGLPDYFDLLPDDTKQRLSDVIRPTRLSGEDTRRYIEECQRRAFGSAKLAPFTTDSATYIASIAAGNPRRIIRLCYMLYRAAAKQRVPVTRALVREVAKEQYETSSAEDVANDLVGIFDRHGWLFERQKALTKAKEGRAEFWLPYGTNGAGSGVLITESILDETEARRLANRVKAIAKAGTEEKPIQVFAAVNGRVADEASAVLSGVPVRLFEYGGADFTDAMDAALTGALQRFERSKQELTLDGLRERLEQMGRQMSSLRRVIDDMTTRLDPREFEAAAESGLRHVFASLSEGNFRIPADYPIVRRRLRDMTRVFDDLRAVIQGRMSYQEPYRVRTVLHVVDDMEHVVDDFETQLARFLRTQSSDSRYFSAEISRICRAADDVIETTWRRYSSELRDALTVDMSSTESDLLRRLEQAYISLPREVYYILEDEPRRSRSVVDSPNVSDQ
jgi:Cdc6-like AAA superfamily ATPase